MRYVLEAARPILIDLLSTIVFFILLWTTHDFILATALGIAAGAIEVTIRLIRRKPIGVITWMSLGLVVIMGSASILTHQPLFVMLKPTIAYTLVGAAMLKRGWMHDYLPEIAKPYLTPDDLAPWGYAWSGLMFFSAALNIALALTLGPNAWSTTLSIFGLASKWCSSRSPTSRSARMSSVSATQHRQQTPCLRRPLHRSFTDRLTHAFSDLFAARRLIGPKRHQLHYAVHANFQRSAHGLDPQTLRR
ncbi:MAG: septation protein IspZ [Caulobacteraceae bacterium]|nr:septation protein IspZ [Caulobacteraceae bacterium]